MTLDYSQKEIKTILEKNDFESQLPEFQDREIWKKIKNKSLSKEIIEKANSIIKEPLPDVRFTDYKKFHKAGDRKAYEKPANKKKTNLKHLVIAEGIKRNDKYRDYINDYIWSFCEETAWVMSAHLSYYDV